jgi:hypothetical protein
MTVMNTQQEAATTGPQQPPPGQQVTIFVNTQPHIMTKGEISFAEVVALSGLPDGPTVVFTVTYRRGQGGKPEGSLVAGESVKVKDGMIFNVTRTDKS